MYASFGVFVVVCMYSVLYQVQLSNLLKFNVALEEERIEKKEKRVNNCEGPSV